MPIFWFCLAAIIGIFTASLFSISQIVWISIALFSFLFGIFEYFIFRRKKHVLLTHPLFRIPFLLIVGAFFLGGVRFQAAAPAHSPENLLWYADGSTVTLTGSITSDPNHRTNISTSVVASETIEIDGRSVPITGNISLLLPSGFNIQYGDRLILTGALERTFPPGSLPTTSYLARKKQFTQMNFPHVEIVSRGNGNKFVESSYRFRNLAHETIYYLMPFPESAVLSGILLGKEGGIPDYLWDGYQASGTVHIIAISGFNISLIVYWLSRFFRKIIGWKWYLIPTILAVLFYTIIAGADPPVVRAAIMGLFALPAYQIGRKVLGIHSLTLAGAIMAMINPFMLWDMSFQLSFLASLALLTLVDPVDNWICKRLENLFQKERVKSLVPLINFLSTTLTSAMVVFPVIFRIDQNISLINLIANLFILPPQPAIMVIGGLAVLFRLIVPPVGRLLGIISWPLIAFCNQIAIRFSMSDAAVIPLPEYVYWVSLISTVLVLLYASITQIIGFSKPRLRE